MKIEVIKSAIPLLAQGMVLTVQITLISLVIAVLIGLLSCFMCISKNPVLRTIGNGYVWIIRGTPLIVQVFFIYFGIPPIFANTPLAFRWDRVVAGIVAVSLNAGAYMSEIFRGGILAVSKGQMEAARSLGLPYGVAMFKVILPQAIRISIPALTNQVIITLKDVSLLYSIGIGEILMTGKQIVGRTMESTIIYGMIGVFYLIVVTILAKLSKKIERSMAYEQKSKRNKTA